MLSHAKAYLSRIVRYPVFAYAKTKTQISFAVTVKLISAFVFTSDFFHFIDNKISLLPIYEISSL